VVSLTVQVLLDGGTDRPGGPFPLTGMPALAELARTGTVADCDWLDPGVPVGSETAIASILGWRPSGPVDRGAVEAAARGLTGAMRRIDLPGGHRLLVGAGCRLEAAGPLRIWPAGAIPPRILNSDTVIIGAPGAATGLGALMGARTVIPDGVTGLPGSPLSAKTAAAVAAVHGGARRVLVHIGGADSAGHARDRNAKRAVLAAADAEVIAPLAALLEQRPGARLEVGADHGTDPDSGEHVGGPQPWVFWSAR
jgi:2,3-bisphosphoglycerate-independent phosphoglycerate mutase